MGTSKYQDIEDKLLITGYTQPVITSRPNTAIRKYIGKKKNIKIAFNEYPKFSYKNCLVLYSNIEPYENMEYRSYWNDPNIAIIQNPELIENINKTIK